MNDQQIQDAVVVLRSGGLIAYPTEAVWGLGCDPLNPTALDRLLALKQRSPDKGFILVACDYEQLEPLLGELPGNNRQEILASWPGPVTWVVPAGTVLPGQITGGRETVAVRVSAHPVVQALCQAFAGPIVSTSANRSGEVPAVSEDQVSSAFSDEIDLIVAGHIGTETSPTIIRDAMTGEVIRPA